MNRRLVAGNWKMNLDYQAGRELVNQCVEGLRSVRLPVVFCPPFIHLKACEQVIDEVANVHLGAQDLSAHAAGPHTGELSGAQLRSVGCEFVIVGHSERRADLGEGGPLLRAKVERALEAGLRPIYCFGETLAEREGGEEESIVANQLAEGLAHLDPDALAAVVLAYEPVWAIGTGRTASPEQAQAMHAYVRGWVERTFSPGRAAEITILYGGSVKPGNAAELFAQPDIDGALVGGASLVPDDFVAIVNAFPVV